MTLRRFFVAAAAVFTCPGCHTASAVRQLSTPSPVKDLSVRLAEAEPTALLWQAGYGYSDYPDAFLTTMFDRTVYHGGRWTVPAGTSVCVPVLGGFLPALPGKAYVLFSIPGAPGTPHPEPLDLLRAEEAGCTHVLRVDSSARYVEAVRLLPVAVTATAIPLPLPEERPAADARRWGWLAAAPLFDVATIVAMPFVAIFFPLTDPGAAPAGS